MGSQEQEALFEAAEQAAIMRVCDSMPRSYRPGKRLKQMMARDPRFAEIIKNLTSEDAQKMRPDPRFADDNGIDSIIRDKYPNAKFRT